MTKTTVVYHSADFDGIFCREIARKFLPDAELIGWDFGNAPINPATLGETLYVLDLPLDRPFGFKFEELTCDPAAYMKYGNRIGNATNIIWIDHHKSSIESHPQNIPGYRIDGVAACRLAWQWFYLNDQHWDQDVSSALPTKQNFINRKVSEPLAVRLAGEYDIWDKRDPDAELFQHGLRSRDLTNDWPLLLVPDKKASIEEIERLIDVGHRNLLRPDGTNPNPIVLGLLENGKVLQYAKTQENADIIKSSGFTVTFEGLTFLACNHARFNSLLFAAGVGPEHDALLGFRFGGKRWHVSLYHAPGKEHHDLSLIAVKYGGGGHKGACGFVADKLPWVP